MMKRAEPEISVVMAVHNGEKYLSLAIESILAQTRKHFEFLIIDDGSTDCSREIIEKYRHQDPRIRLLTQENNGLAASLNRGIKAAKAQYIARMDADDIARPKRLDEQFRFMEAHPDIVLCGTFVQEINEQGKKIRTSGPGVFHFDRLPYQPADIRRVAMRHVPIIHPSMFFRKKPIMDVGSYDETFKASQDYDLLFRLLQRHDCANVPKILLDYRRYSGSVSDTRMKVQEAAAIRARWLAIKRGIYPISSFVYLMKPLLSYLVPARTKAWIFRRMAR